MKVKVTANGNFPVTEEGVTQETSLVINAPKVMGGTVAIGYMDTAEPAQFVPYADGDLGAGESKVYNTGVNVPVVANVSGFSASFILRSAESRSR